MFPIIPGNALQIGDSFCSYQCSAENVKTSSHWTKKTKPEYQRTSFPEIPDVKGHTFHLI